MISVAVRSQTLTGVMSRPVYVFCTQHFSLQNPCKPIPARVSQLHTHFGQEPSLDSFSVAHKACSDRMRRRYEQRAKKETAAASQVTRSTTMLLREPVSRKRRQEVERLTGIA